MNHETTFRLTGGTFLTLLIEGKNKITARQKGAGIKDGSKDIRILFDLYYVGDTKLNYGLFDNSSFPRICSNYKNCNEISSPNYLLIEDEEWTNKFIKRLNTVPNNCINDTKNLINNHINKDKILHLTNALINLISLDELISDDTPVYYSFDKTLVTKKELLSMTEINITSLILGVLYYLASNKFNNSLGKPTIDNWYPNGPTGKFKNPFWTDETSIKVLLPNNEQIAYEEELEDEIQDDLEETTDEEVIEVLEDTKKEEASEDTSPKETTIIQNSPFIITGGTQTINVHYGDNHITNNYNGKKED